MDHLPVQFAGSFIGGRRGSFPERRTRSTSWERGAVLRSSLFHFLISFVLIGS
jgi:hypothetical protein